MQATAGSSFVEMLKRKDDKEFDSPSDWDFIRKHKNFTLLQIEEGARFEHVIASSCIEPCMKNTKTSVVATEESECMTNCISRGFQTRALF